MRFWSLQGSNPSPWSIASNLKANGSGESEDEGISPHEPPAVQDGDWEPREHPANKALLSREDLDRHFGYGLKEAAVRLGVCKTTLKRACRHATLQSPILFCKQQLHFPSFAAPAEGSGVKSFYSQSAIFEHQIAGVHQSLRSANF